MKKGVMFWYCGIALFQMGACFINFGLSLMTMGVMFLFFSYIEFKTQSEEEEEQRVKKAILLSSHQVVAKLELEEIKKLGAMHASKDAEDFIKVECVDGRVLWCDSIVITENEDYED